MATLTTVTLSLAAGIALASPLAAAPLDRMRDLTSGIAIAMTTEPSAPSVLIASDISAVREAGLYPDQIGFRHFGGDFGAPFFQVLGVSDHTQVQSAFANSLGADIATIEGLLSVGRGEHTAALIAFSDTGHVENAVEHLAARSDARSTLGVLTIGGQIGAFDIRARSRDDLVRGMRGHTALIRSDGPRLMLGYSLPAAAIVAGEAPAADLLSGDAKAVAVALNDVPANFVDALDAVLPGDALPYELLVGTITNVQAVDPFWVAQRMAEGRIAEGVQADIEATSADGVPAFFGGAAVEWATRDGLTATAFALNFLSACDEAEVAAKIIAERWDGAPFFQGDDLTGLERLGPLLTIDGGSQSGDDGFCSIAFTTTPRRPNEAADYSEARRLFFYMLQGSVALLR